MKRTPPKPPRQPITWVRADPALLAVFDPASKECTMNCGPHADDPRSKAERMLLCDDCVPADPGAQLVRFCPECGHLGEFDRRKHRGCCPDGALACYVPRLFAERCHATFVALQALQAQQDGR